MLAELTKRYPLLIRDGALFIDNSTLEKITTCPRSAFYYMIRKRELNGRKDSLNFGSGMHAGLASLYTDYYKDSFNDKDSVDRALKCITDHFEANPQDSETFRTVDRAVDMLLQYHKKYTVEPFTIHHMHEFDKKPCVEIPFAVPIGRIEDVPIIWTGRIDAVIRWDKLLWILDHKTTSIFGGTYFEQFRNSGQFIGYCWAYEQVMHERVHGVLINALAIRKITPSGKPVEFARERIDYTRDQINEWQQNTMRIINTFLGYAVAGLGLDNDLANTDEFPMHSPWCHNKYGKCQYFEVCTLPINQRDVYLNSREFAPVTWNPLD